MAWEMGIQRIKTKKSNSISENGYNITNIQAGHDEGLTWGSVEVESGEGI